MGWSNWPPTTGTDIQGWDYLSQMFRARREKQAMLGGNFDWPPGALGWGAGTVVSVSRPAATGTDLVVDCGPVDWTPLPNCSSPRWVNMTCPDCERNFIPAGYDLVIETPDRDDPWQTVRGAVKAEDWAGTAGDDGTLTVDGTMVLNWATGGIIESLDALAGRRFILVRSGADANPTPTERLPYKPNEQESWVGTNATGGTVTIALGDDDAEDPPTYSYLTDAKATWAADHWVDATGSTSSFDAGSPASDVDKFDALIFDTAGLLHRVSVKHNSPTTLYFDEQPWTAAGTYSIVPKGNKGVPGRPRWRPYRWYSGLPRQMYGHDVDDSVGLSNQPTNSGFWDEGDACTQPTDGSAACKSTDHLAMDADLAIAYDNTCEPGRAGSVLVRDYWSTIRSLQIDIVGLCGGFVPPGSSRPYTFTPALLFQFCGINSGTSSLSYDGTNWSFSASTTYSGHPIYWTVMRDSEPYQSGTGTPDANGNVALAATFTTDHGVSSDPRSDVGLQVVYSAGWTRYYPEWFRYPVERTCFVPDVDVAVDGSVTVIDPPDVELAKDANGNPLDYYNCNGRGTWQTRPKSAAPVQGAAAFEAGHYYRLVGDNFDDPGINPAVEPSPFNTAMVPYWDHYYRGTLSPGNQLKWKDSRSGRIASGTARSITAEGVDWWTDWCNASSADSRTARITSVVPGQATVQVSPPIAPSVASWAVTDDTDGSGTGTVVLIGTAGFQATGTQDVALLGEFTAAMANTAPVGQPQNGYTVSFVFHGAMHVESGTATGGTATTLADSAKNTADNHQRWGCWWATAAFQGRPAFQDFILEVAKADNTGFKTPIVTTSSGTGGVVITFAPADGLAIEVGDTYAIREPAYTINKWRGCPLTITDPDGNEYHATITHNDAETLYFDPIEGLDPPEDWTDWKFAIAELQYGGVYQWDGQKMVPTAGMTDTVRLGVPANPQKFLADLTCNLEGFKAGYGPVQVGDVVGGLQLSEIFWTLNAMYRTLAGMSWSSRADPNVQELNGLTLNGGAAYDGRGGQPFAPADQPTYESTTYQTFSDATQATEADLQVQTPQPYEIVQPPTLAGVFQYETVYRNPADTGGLGVTTDGFIGVQSANNYAYGVVTTAANMLAVPCTIEGIMYCCVAQGDPAVGETVTYSNGVSTGPNGEVPVGATGDNERYDVAVAFDADGSPAILHDWVSIGTWAPGAAVGDRTVSPKVGSNDVELPPLKSEPPAPPVNYPESDYTLNGSDVVGTYGYTATQQIAIVNFSPEYAGATSASASTASASVAQARVMIAAPVALAAATEGAAAPKVQAATWPELHGKIMADQEWLDDFSSRVPCATCRAHWTDWVTANPPDFGGGWYLWTIAAHNAVNERLGKPQFVPTT